MKDAAHPVERPVDVDDFRLLPRPLPMRSYDSVVPLNCRIVKDVGQRRNEEHQQENAKKEGASDDCWNEIDE